MNEYILINNIIAQGDKCIEGKDGVSDH
jgi:hypothetical protein